MKKIDLPAPLETDPGGLMSPYSQDYIDAIAKSIAPFLNINWDAKDFTETSNGCEPEEDREYCRGIACEVIKAIQHHESDKQRS